MYRRLFKNTFLVFIGTASMKLIGFIMLPLYTRWLSVEDFGTTDIIQVYVTLLSAIFSFAISDAIFVFPKDQPLNQQKKYFSSSFFVIFSSLFIFGLLLGVISRFVDCRNDLFFDYIWYIYALVVTTIVQSSIQQFLRSIDKLIVYSSSGLVNTISLVIFAFALTPKLGVIGYVYSVILSNVVSIIYILIFSGAYRYLGLKFVSVASAKEMLRYSIPLIPNGIMWWLVSALNRPIMEIHIGLFAIGIYAVANKVSGILSTVFQIFSSSWQISVLEEFKKSTYESFFNSILLYVLFVLFIVHWLLTLFSDFIVKCLSTPDYYESSKLISLMAFSAILFALGSLVGANFSAGKESKYYFLSTSIGGIVALISNFLLIPLLNLYGAALASIFSFAAILISRFYYSKKYVTIRKWNNIAIIMFCCVFNIIASIFTTGYLKQLFLFAILFISFILNKDIVLNLINILSSYLKRKEKSDE